MSVKLLTHLVRANLPHLSPLKTVTQQHGHRKQFDRADALSSALLISAGVGWTVLAWL